MEGLHRQHITLADEYFQISPTFFFKLGTEKTDRFRFGKKKHDIFNNTLIFGPVVELV
ncbi:MAG: hypothetical protein U1D70_10030 [Methylobacter sp.]|nr:hypothetical protein [Methylobacter sp.]